jgi:hypothetical protein
VSADDDAGLFELQDADLGADDPGEAAKYWFRLLAGQDQLVAWRCMERDYRLCMAQQWIWTSPWRPSLPREELERIALDFLSSQPRHRLWPVFLRSLAEWAQVTAPWERVGVLSSPRPLGLDLEMVVLADADIEVVEAGAAVVCTAVILRRVENGWRIAGVGEWLQEPGWPPRRGQKFEIYPTSNSGT